MIFYHKTLSKVDCQDICCLMNSLLTKDIPEGFHGAIVDDATDAFISDTNTWENMIQNWNNIEDDYNIVQSEVDECVCCFFEREGEREATVGEDGRSVDVDAFVPEEVPSDEDIIAMYSKIQLYLRAQHSDGQAANMMLSVERCLRKEKMKKRQSQKTLKNYFPKGQN